MLKLNRLVAIFVVSFFLLSGLMPARLSTDSEVPWWDENWSFREEIILPINTSDKNAHYQPVDIFFEFENICWAKNESEHSVRVIFHEGDNAIELDCQIYDLNFSDDEHIKSCGIVFLIPDFADGYERYFIYYDDEITDIPSYDDHVDIDESSYSYEPVKGLSFESWFYIIIEDGYYVYAVSQRGKALDEYVSQQVVKLKKDADNVMPNNAEQTASFSFVYYWLDGNDWKHISSGERLISKKVIVNGNLMVKFLIVSQSNDGLIQSKNYYKYYYSPSEDKGIYADVEHKIVSNSLPQGDEIDVSFIVLTTGGIRSSSIEDLNFGRIPKFLHFYHEDQGFFTHEMDQHPEDTNGETVIGSKDDYDIGNYSWLSIDDGETGKAYGIIFDSNDVVESGLNERNGIELQLWQVYSIRYPGLDGRFSYIYFTRNSYEEGEEIDNTLPDDYLIKFKALFYATENGGYTKVEEEAKIYPSLVDLQPENDEDIIDGDYKEEEYNLTIFTHLSQLLNLRLFSSMLLLKNIFITVELYKENMLMGIETSSRLAIADGWLDWKNISFFRTATFLPQKPGRYVAKVYLENALFSEGREFIGYKIFDITKDIKVDIFCKPERKIIITYLDQEENSVENVETNVIIDDEIISKTYSDSDGKTKIGLPAGFNEIYSFKSIYDGFLIKEDQIKLGIINNLIPVKKTISFNVYDLKLNIKDSEGKTPDFDIDISLTSTEMQNPVVLKPDEVTDGVYYFNNLYPANYQIKIKYYLAEIIDDINIQKNISKDINFYGYTIYLKDELDLPPEATIEISLKSQDFKKTVVFNCECLSDGKFVFSDLYPGKYILSVSYRSYLLEKNVTIPNDDNDNTTIVFPILYNLEAYIFDSHGIPLKNVKVVLYRGGKEIQDFSDDNGKIKFVIPPGLYATKVYSDDTIVAQRNVNVLNDKQYDVVTIVEPITLFLVVIIVIITIGAIAFIFIKRKDSLFFLKLLAMFIAIVALVSPWWSINGELSDPILKTSTNMYIMPSNMITITSNTDIITGEISSLAEEFNLVMNLISFLIIFSIILVFLTIILRNLLNKKRLSIAIFVLSVIILVGCLFVFCYAMSDLANIIVGSFIGNGNINFDVYADNIFESIACSWGPGIGFYMFVSSIVILLFVNFITIKKNKFKTY